MKIDKKNIDKKQNILFITHESDVVRHKNELPNNKMTQIPYISLAAHSLQRMLQIPYMVYPLYETVKFKAIREQTEAVLSEIKERETELDVNHFLRKLNNRGTLFLPKEKPGVLKKIRCLCMDENTMRGSEAVVC